MARFTVAVYRTRVVYEAIGVVVEASSQEELERQLCGDLEDKVVKKASDDYDWDRYDEECHNVKIGEIEKIGEWAKPQLVCEAK